MPNETHHKSSKPFRDAKNAPRVGVPWRTAAEEAAKNRYRYDDYLRAVREAGGEPVEISLALEPEELKREVATLDAIVLPGSPADVDPARYGAGRHPKCADPDLQRERTDSALLEHAFTAKKPVLAICYGVQSLNVYLGGTLIQDIPSELGTQIRHDKQGLPPGSGDPRHAARIEAGSKLAALAGGVEAEVNSSHHQAILAAGKSLRVTARAPDEVIEAVEWAGDANWVVGAQWHPERMPGDALAAALFRELVAAARGVAVRV
jgi:putative glutamine amidotransferase